MTPYYQDESVTIYHADCREVLPFVSADLLLTDPPYGIGEAAGKNRSRTKVAAAKDYGSAEWDNEVPPSWLLDFAQSRCRWSVIWGGNYFGLPASSCWLVWDKDNTGDFADCELAWTNIPKAVRKIRHRWNGMLQEPGIPREFREHPTQKPEAVMLWALNQAPNNQTVLDPFMGSGTTLAVAKRTGRKAIGIEIEERYCEIAANRCRQGALTAMFTDEAVS